MSKEVNIPAIVTANTYFWRPAGRASDRRANEQRHRETVERFLEEIKNVPMACSFDYSESCKNVYKTFSVYRPDGRKSNITGLISEARKVGIELVK